MLPLANVIELTVTLLPVPTFLLLKVEPTVWPKVSEPTSPVKVKVVVAVVVPSYVLLAAEAVAVKVFTATSAVIVE